MAANKHYLVGISEKIISGQASAETNTVQWKGSRASFYLGFFKIILKLELKQGHF